MVDVYKIDDENIKDNPEFLKSPDAAEADDEEDLQKSYLQAVSNVLNCNLRRLSQYYLDSIEQISDCAMKISLNKFFDQNFELLISKLLSVLQEKRKYIIETVQTLQILIKFQDIYVADIFIKNGGINVLLETVDSPELSLDVINPVLDTLSAIAAMSRNFCNFVLAKFPISMLREQFMDLEDDVLRCSISSLIHSIARHPLSTFEVRDIITLFLHIFDSGIEICFAPSIASLSMILQRKGVEQLINQTGIIERILSLIDYNDVVKANVCRAIGCATQNPHISIEFDVTIVLDCLKSDVVDVTTAAAYCVSLLVSNRSDFLETFNLFEFISELLITFRESPFRTRPYVAEAIIDLCFLMDPEDLFQLINNGFWEVPLLIFNERDDIILTKKAFRLCNGILLKCEEDESTLYIVDAFIDENGFDSIQNLLIKYAGSPLMFQEFIDEIEYLLDHFTLEKEC